MTGLFITESMDSRHVALENFDNGDYRHHFLRLRLNIVARILLGHTIIVPQGWAMDSLPLFKVIAEIAAALKDIPSGHKHAAEIRDFSPFMRESHVGDLPYADMLLLYLQRDDCYWAGLPPLRDAKCRQYLHDEVAKGLREPRFGTETFQRLAEDCLSAEESAVGAEVAGHWAQAFDYFSRFERRNPLRETGPSGRAYARRVSKTMPPGAYRGNVARALEAVTSAGADMGDPAVQDIVRFSHLLARYPGTQSTSRILSLANNEIGNADARDAIQHISMFAQIRAAALQVDADASAPAIPGDRPPGLLLGNNLLEAAFTQTGCAPGIVLKADIDADLATRLETMDWVKIWRDAILLSFDDDWTELRDQVSRSAADRRTRLDLKGFHQLQQKLAGSCPDLVLERSAAARIGIRLRDSTVKKAASAVTWVAGLASTAVATTCVAPEIGLEFPAHHLLLGCAAGPLMGVAAASVGRAVNPFMTGNCLSSTASIFEISEARP